MDDAFTGSSSFDAVEDVVRNTVDDMDFLDDDAVNDRITEAIRIASLIRFGTWCARCKRRRHYVSLRISSYHLNLNNPKREAGRAIPPAFLLRLSYTRAYNHHWPITAGNL